MARKRGTETMGDMVRSMAVVLIPVAFIAGLIGLIRPSSETVRDVEWEAALDSARTAAEYDLLGPQSVPEGWSATSVSYESGTSSADGVWRMNFVTAERGYVGLVQRAGDVETVVRRELPDFEPDGTSGVSGESWDRYVETGVADPDVALVQERPDSVVVLIGSESYAELESFASSLR
jgi:hypothetical protein